MAHFDVVASKRFRGQLDLNNGSIAGFVKLTATKAIPEGDSGKSILVGPAAAGLGANATATLPAATDGLFFKFIYAGNAADAQNFLIDTGSDTNFFLGGLAHYDSAADDVNGIPDLVFGDGDSNSVLTITTPTAGTVVECYCDGTNWFLSGNVVSATAPSFADQS